MDDSNHQSWHPRAFTLPWTTRITVKAQEPKRFQYMIVEVLPDTQNMQTKLNEYGASGWELVAVPMGSMTEPRLIFKK
ncbi:MAG: hypothetical protein HC938_09390 [Nitrospira sp.]|nr:hypothetical protein [Nitrospira sp.]